MEHPRSLEDFKNLSEQEKRDFIRNMVRDKDSQIKAVFLNAETNEQVTLSELAEKISEDELVERLYTIMNNDTEMKGFSTQDIIDAKERAAAGTATEEDYEILDFASKMYGQSNSFHFQKEFVELLMNLLYFSQSKVGYRPEMNDLISALHVINTVNMITTPDSEMYKYCDANPAIPVDLARQIGDDIYDTWKATCTSKVDPHLLVSALITIIQRVCAENSIMLNDFEVFADRLGLEAWDDEDDDEDGSNEEEAPNNIIRPAVFSGNPIEGKDNQEMKDLLKD